MSSFYSDQTCNNPDFFKISRHFRSDTDIKLLPMPTTSADVYTRVENFNQRNLQIVGSELLLKRIDDAIKQCPIIQNLREKTVKAPTSKKKASAEKVLIKRENKLRNAAICMVNILLKQVAVVPLQINASKSKKPNDVVNMNSLSKKYTDPEHYHGNNFYRYDISDVEDILHNVTSEKEFERDITLNSKHGWRKISNPILRKIFGTEDNKKLIKDLISTRVLERFYDYSTIRKNKLWKPPVYYRVPVDIVMSLTNMTDKLNNEDISKMFNSNFTDLKLRFGVGVHENMIEALNLYSLNLDIDCSAYDSHIKSNYLGKKYKGRLVTEEQMQRWLNDGSYAISEFQKGNPRYIATLSGKQYRRSTFLNRLPKAIREVILKHNKWVSFDFQSMHWNIAVSQFLKQLPRRNRLKQSSEIKRLRESTGDTKTYFSKKLDISRSTLGNRVNSYLYSTNSANRDTLLGKYITKHFPAFKAWCESIKLKNRKDITNSLYPQEYKTITSIMLKLHELEIPCVTVHDCVCFPEEHCQTGQKIIEEVRQEMDILSTVKEETAFKNNKLPEKIANCDRSISNSILIKEQRCIDSYSSKDESTTYINSEQPMKINRRAYNCTADMIINELKLAKSKMDERYSKRLRT